MNVTTAKTLIILTLHKIQTSKAFIWHYNWADMTKWLQES